MCVKSHSSVMSIVLRNRIVWKQIHRKRGGTKSLITETRYVARTKVPTGYSIAYKLANPNSTSFEGYIKYKVGYKYTYNERIRLAESGLHYCPKAIDCLSFISNSQNKYNLFKVYIHEDSKRESDMGEDLNSPINGVTSSIIIADRLTKKETDRKLTGFVAESEKFFGRVYLYYYAGQPVCKWYPQRGLILPLLYPTNSNEEEFFLCAEADNLDEATNICKQRVHAILFDNTKVTSYKLRATDVLGCFTGAIGSASVVYISPFVGIGSFSRKKNLRIEYDNRVFFWVASNLVIAQNIWYTFCDKRKIV